MHRKVEQIISYAVERVKDNTEETRTTARSKDDGEDLTAQVGLKLSLLLPPNLRLWVGKSRQMHLQNY